MNNIKLNSFEGQVIPCCFALSERELLVRLYMKSKEARALMHSFGSEVSAEWRMNAGFAQTTIGVSADFLHSNFDLPRSKFVKIDIHENEVRNSKGGRDLFMEYTRSLFNPVHDRFFFKEEE